MRKLQVRTLFENLSKVYLHISKCLALALVNRHRPSENQRNLCPLSTNSGPHPDATLT